MVPPSVPQAVQSCHEFLLWLIPQLDKFPRVRRFTLGERLEMRLSRLRKDPSFILREPQDERSGHWNYWGFSVRAEPFDRLRAGLSKHGFAWAQTYRHVPKVRLTNLRVAQSG